MDTKLTRFNHDTTLRLLRHRGIRGYGGEGQAVAHDSNQVNRHGKTRTGEGKALATVTTQAVTADVIEIENPDPMKRSLRWNRPPRGLKRILGNLRKRIRFQFSVWFPKPTEAELEKKRIQAEKLKLFYTMLDDSYEIRHTISKVWERLMYYDRPAQPVSDTGRRRPPKLRPPQFDISVFDPNGNWIDVHVDTREGMFPSGVKLGTLFSQENLNEVQYTLPKIIQGHAYTYGGVIHYNRSGTNGIPTEISILDMWKEMTPNMPMLTWPVGSAGTHIKFKNLQAAPHVLFVGITGRGKSNGINGLICTYLHRGLTPADVQFIMLDCKGGMEFGFYAGLPHLYRDDELEITGLVTNQEKIVPTVNALITVMKQRMAIISGAHCKHWEAYNLKVRTEKRLPALLVIFDDIISITSIYGNNITNPLKVLVSQCRAAGMHVILGGQYPKSTEVDTAVTVNMPVVIAMHMKTPSASRAMIGSDAAAYIVDKPGRCVFSDEYGEQELQMGLISDGTIDALVKEAITGKKQNHAAKRLDEETILKFALETFGGRLDLDKLYSHYRGLIGYKALLSVLKKMDDRLFVVDGEEYVVTMRLGRPRRMLRQGSPDYQKAYPSVNPPVDVE